MAPRQYHAERIALTDVEFEMMSVLWKLQEGSINDILEALPAHRKLAYTSVSTIVRILEQKNYVSSIRDGRTAIYSPTLSREAYENATVSRVVAEVFENSPSSLVRTLVQTKMIDQKDLDEIRKIIAGIK